MTSIDASTYQQRLTEDQMQKTVSDLVTLRGGRLIHVRRSDVAPELVDLPDWLIIDPMSGRVFLIECKSQARKVTPGQAAMMAMLEECSRFESGIVRPEPKHDGEIPFDDFLKWLGGS